MPKLVLDHVTRKFGDIAAVSDLSLEVRDGELMVLIGPSGCGKSTVLRLIAGVEPLTSGNIYIGGELVNTVPSWKRNVAMVFESPHHALYPHMTAYDNMAFGLRMSKETVSESEAPGGKPEATPQPPLARSGKAARDAGIRKRVENVAGRLGLRPYLGRKREELSAGHSQGVALGKAMVRHARVFLMDDPLSQLDAQHSTLLRTELRKLHAETGATILFVTHDQAEAMQLGNRIAVMDNGVLQQVGTPQNLYNHPANTFVAGFIGSPGMNILPVELGEPGSTQLTGQGFTLTLPTHYLERLPANSRILLGLRPEHIGDASRMPDAPPGTRISGRVDLTENTGSELYLYLTIGDGAEIVAQLDHKTNTRRGQQFEVAFDMENIHAFDPVSGRSLL